MNVTKIEWCDSTLNPVVGCTFGCTYCYARKLNNRFNWIPNWNEPQFFPERLKQLSSKKSQNIFMNSMSDIADWKDEWIHKVALAIIKNPQHNYLFLTKRIDDIYQHAEEYSILLSNENVWLGVTITNNSDLEERLFPLIMFEYFKCHLFVSIEPIHEHIESFEWYSGIEWIIVGAETGNRKNKIIPEDYWVNNLTYDTRCRNIPLFYKESMLPIVGENQMFREIPRELTL